MDTITQRIAQEIEQRTSNLIRSDRRAVLTTMICDLACTIACLESPENKLKPRARGCYDCLIAHIAKQTTGQQLTVKQTMSIYSEIINYCTDTILCDFQRRIR